MNILGLHFGHDASLTLIRDGRVISHVLVERHIRVKQCVGIRTAQLVALLSDAGMEWREVDFCAIVSTQDLEILTGLIEDFSIDPEETRAHVVRSPFADLLRTSGMMLPDMLSHGLRRLVKLDGEEAEQAQQERWKMLLPEWQSLREDSLAACGWLNAFTTHPKWQKQRGLDQIRDDRVDPATFSESIRLGMHLPVTVCFQGLTKPAYFIDHHVCHAASAYYRSGFSAAAILTHDGGDATRGLSGLYCYGEGKKLYVLAPHHLMLGGMYRNTGIRIGFDLIGSEGKLMGLSSYGHPRFFDQRFVGNAFDIQRRFGKAPFRAWFEHCLAEGEARGYELTYGSGETVLSNFCKDIAASTQRVFEASYLAAVNVVNSMLAGLGRRTSNLCLSGGAALNCPGNSSIYCDSPFPNMYIDPNCDDGGLSLGAALYLFHNMLGHEIDSEIAEQNRSPYMGIRQDAAIARRVIESQTGTHDVSRPADWARQAASDIHANRLVAWYEGRSEMGPRALCHRSLLASPRRQENWAHVNRVKGRESWRPLAPVVLEEDASEWFADCPSHSPYMLYTARTRSRSIPAVTHVDGSARIQTVTAQSGKIYDVLTELRTLSGCSVAINTSLNQRGEPIVETPDEAMSLFNSTDVEVLFVDGWRIAKRSKVE